MDKTATIVQFRSMVENLPTSKKNLGVAKNLVQAAEDSKGVIDLSDPDFLRILNALQESVEFFVSNDKIKEATYIADRYIDFLEELDNSDEMISRTQSLANTFFAKKDSAYHIYSEDLVNRVVSFLDDDSMLEKLGTLLIEIAQTLQKVKIYEMAINYYERGVTYFIDANNKDQVLQEISSLLETARVLSLKNNEYSSNYIDLVNTLVKEADIDLSSDVNTQLAYQSFSDHLLKSSKGVVESRFTQSGRLHKKKREFFKKKVIDED